MQGGVTGRREIVEDAALLLAQGVAHREQALREATAVGTVAAETGVAPQHAMAFLLLILACILSSQAEAETTRQWTKLDSIGKTVQEIRALLAKPEQDAIVISDLAKLEMKMLTREDLEHEFKPIRSDLSNLDRSQV